MQDEPGQEKLEESGINLIGALNRTQTNISNSLPAIDQSEVSQHLSMIKNRSTNNYRHLITQKQEDLLRQINKMKKNRLSKPNRMQNRETIKKMVEPYFKKEFVSRSIK